MRFRNGVFVINEEDDCPLYNAGEEFELSEGILTLPAAKPTCMTLASDLLHIAAEERSFESFSKGFSEKVTFSCGGCTGNICFEFKKDKGYATLQMKLLEAAEKREKAQCLNEFAGLLRSIKTFSTLTDGDLLDLASLLELQEYPWQFPIAQKGDPGHRLFILLSGTAELLDEKGVVLSEMHSGEIFGEMSLLSGERVTMTVMAATPCKVAIMKDKDFRHILTRFPSLQVFFYKLLVERITKVNNQRAEELASGIAGQLNDISAVELCQMIKANHKTGLLHVEDDSRRGRIVFNQGEIVLVEMNGQEGKAAFQEILGLKDGRFKFSQGLSPKERKLAVLDGFMDMLP